MNNTIEKGTEEASVSRLAYELWENAGRPAGRDLEFWLAAEARVRRTTSRSTGHAAIGAAPATPAQVKAHKAPRTAANGTKKTWPKPYPNLPKF